MSLPIIERVAITTVMVPINPPHRTASGVVAASPLVLLDVHGSDHLIGHAILFAYTPAALKPLGDLVLNLSELLLGQPLAPRALHEMCQARCRLIGSHGLVGMALAGLDMALWDALARHRREPLCRLLGGDFSMVQAYAGTGYDGESETARQAERWVKLGFRAVKAKIGYPSVGEDRLVVRAMRHAVGGDVALMVDYNQSLTAAAAIARMQLLDEESLDWVEEPVLAHDHAASARVRAAIRTPLQSGENWWGPLDMQQALQAGAGDHVMPDVMKIGGVTGWLQAVALAEAQGIPVSSHLWPEVSAQLLCAGRTSHRLEYVDWWAPILLEPLLIEQGQVVFDPEMVGSGVAWRAAAVERYRV